MEMDWDEIRQDLRPVTSNTCTDISVALEGSHSARYVSTLSGWNVYETDSIEGELAFDATTCELSIGSEVFEVTASDYDEAGRLYIELDGQPTSVDSPHILGESLALLDNNGNLLGYVVMNRG